MEANILLNAMALGPMTSSEIGLLLGSVSDQEYEKLSEVLCGVSIPNDLAKETIGRVLTHQTEMTAKCGRQITIKSAAMDYLECKNLLSPGIMSVSELSKMAFYDELTDIANFRYFSMKLNDEACRAKRYKHVMSLIMTDLDKFKSVNDKYGHQVGNDVLKKFVKVLNESVRDTDFVARYGGEEFAIILPETSKMEAFEISERIRSSVESTDFAGLRLTASFGLACFGRDTFDKDNLVTQADEALYASKRSGRNQTTEFNGGNYPGRKVEFVAGQRKAQLAGTFNKWIPENMPDGRLSIWLAKGIYQYKLILDGRYIEDPLAKERVEDGYGGKNSVLVV